MGARYAMVLRSVDNPDFGQTSPQSPRKTGRFDSLAEGGRTC